MTSFDQGRSSRWNATLSRYGRRTLIALAVIVAVGFMLRAAFVVSPDHHPGDDSLAYRDLAASLYEYGSYGSPGFKSPSDWSPGAPLIYAGAYYLTGGVRDGVARGIEALFGAGTILLAFLLAARLTGERTRPDSRRTATAATLTGGTSPPAPDPAADIDPPPAPDRASDPATSQSTPGLVPGAAPLLAAAMVAFYPPFVAAPGSLMSEPPAEFTLPAAILALFWADRRDGVAPWLLPGVLFGITTLIRPEYLAITACFGLLLLVRRGLADGWGRALLATLLFGLAALAPIVPWTVHNYMTLDRVVPITTGSGKALFTGTYRPGDGEYQRVKAALLFEQTGRRLAPGSAELDRIDPVPLFDRVAARYPELDRDAALGRVGRENLERYLREAPMSYAAMSVRKVWRMWSSASEGTLSRGIGAAIQVILVVLGLAGLLLLAWRRRWEAIALAIPILGITGIAAITLAPPRRNEILMTLILPLASITLVSLFDRIRHGGGPEPAGPSVPEPESPA